MKGWERDRENSKRDMQKRSTDIYRFERRKIERRETYNMNIYIRKGERGGERESEWSDWEWAVL